MRLHDASEYAQHPYFNARREADAARHRERNRDLLRNLFGGESVHNRRMLDVGCDTGALITQAREEFGCDVEGVEVAREAAERGRAAGLTIHLGTVDMLGLPAEHFDFITMIDVIEHVAAPDAVVAAVARLLKPGGRFCVMTPNHAAWVYTLARAGGWLPFVGMPAREKLYIQYHEMYFDRPSLAALCARFGLRIAQQELREFPLDEFGHGAAWAAVVRPLFAFQSLTGRQTLQWLVAEKTPPGKSE